MFEISSLSLVLPSVVAETPSFLPEGLPLPAVAGIAVILVVGLLVVCFRRPAMGRFVGKLVAIVAMGLGVGCLVWGIVAVARGDQPPTCCPLMGAGYSLVIGCGAGFLTSGIVALVLACLIRVPVSSRDERRVTA
jgi:hypothetical protein